MEPLIDGVIYAYAVAIAPDGQTAYVTDFGANTVTPIDIAADLAEPPITGFDYPQESITPDGQTAYVTNSSLIR